MSEKPMTATELIELREEAASFAALAKRCHELLEQAEIDGSAEKWRNSAHVRAIREYSAVPKENR